MRTENEARVLADLGTLCSARGERALSALEASMYIEDCFGFVLSDEEIRGLDLAAADSLKRLIAEKARQ
jgi:hypothetical protein